MVFDTNGTRKQHYSFEDDYFHLSVVPVKAHIMGVLTTMLRDYSKDKTLYSRIYTICTEVVSNIAIHETCGKFEMSVESTKEMLYLSFMIEGEGLTEEKVLSQVELIEKTPKIERALLDMGMGMYACVTRSDYFSIKDYTSEKHKELKKKIIFGFKI